MSPCKDGTGVNWGMRCGLEAAISDNGQYIVVIIQMVMIKNFLKTHYLDKTLTINQDAISLPDWLSFTSDGSLSGTPDNDDVGVHNITLMVNDSKGKQNF